MISRRRVLGLLSGCVGAGLAGCGYRPGGGDIRWRHADLFGLGDVDMTGLTQGAFVAITDHTTSFDVESREWVRGGRISAHAIDSGSEVLNESLSNTIQGAAIGDGVIAVDADETIVVFRLDGSRWELPLASSVVDLAVADNHLFVLTGDGCLIAAADGAERWQRELATGGTDIEQSGLVVVADQRVLCTIGDRVVCFSPEGARRWTRSDLSVARVLVDGGSVVAETRSAVAVLDPATGETRFRGPRGTESAAVTDDAVYFLGDGTLVAFDHSGTRRWSTEADVLAGYDDGRFDGISADYDNRVAADADAVFVTSGSRLFSLAPDDGQARWEVPHETIDAGPFVVDAGVMVVADDDILCHHRER